MGSPIFTPVRCRARPASHNAVPGCHESKADARFPFITATYTPDASGELVPARPDVGPCSARDDVPCAVCLDHLRQRSTGPCFALTVLRCLTHHFAFTLYPPGHVPYGRAAVVPVVAMATLFEAAADAAQGTAWARECPGGTSKWWGTQGRQVAVAVRLCGVLPALDPAAQQAQAAALRVEMLLLVEQARAIAAVPGYRSRGQAVGAVLDRVLCGPCVLERILAAGHLAGLWGMPLLWEPGTRRLRSLSFRGDGTHPP